MEQRKRPPVEFLIKLDYALESPKPIHFEIVETCFRVVLPPHPWTKATARRIVKRALEVAEGAEVA
jgi:hypothetical protein